MISHKYFCDSAAIGILEKKLTKLYEMDVAEKSFSVRLTQRNFSKQKDCVSKKRSQELQMLSRSLSDCEYSFNVMIQVSQFVNDSQLCH